MADKEKPDKGTFQSLLQIMTAEAIYRNIRPDREAVDDLIIDTMAGELSSDGNTKNLWQKYSGHIEEIYTGVILAIQSN